MSESFKMEGNLAVAMRLDKTLLLFFLSRASSINNLIQINLRREEERFQFTLRQGRQCGYI